MAGNTLLQDIEEMTAGVVLSAADRSNGPARQGTDDAPLPFLGAPRFTRINNLAWERATDLGKMLFPAGSMIGGDWRVDGEAMGRPQCEESLVFSNKRKQSISDYGQQWCEPGWEKEKHYTPMQFILAFAQRAEGVAEGGAKSADDVDFVEYGEHGEPIGANVVAEEAGYVLADLLGVDWDAEIARDGASNDDDWLSDDGGAAETGESKSEEAGEAKESGRAPSSHVEIARLFVKRYGDQVRYVAGEGWFVWDGTRWKKDIGRRVFTFARKVCQEAARGVESKSEKNALLHSSTVRGVEWCAQTFDEIQAAQDQFDRDPWLLNTPAGTVDLRTGKMREHRREDFITQMTAVAPADTDECPLWDRVQSEIFEHAPELAAYTNRVAGYSLTGITSEQELFFLQGGGRNGKGVYINTLSGILSEYHVRAPMETFTASLTDRHPTDLAMMRAARLVTAVETQAGRKWDEAKIKQLTGEDDIQARFMRGDFFKYRPKFKLVFLGNNKPGLDNVDEAIKARFNLLPFTTFIPEDRRDPELGEKLKAEWPAILRRFINGCLEWQRCGLNPPEIVRTATTEYLDEEDDLGNWIKECCEENAAFTDTATNLLQSWNGWAQRQGLPPMGAKAFGQKLEGKFARGRTGGGRFYKGVRVRAEAAPGGKAEDTYRV